MDSCVEKHQTIEDIRVRPRTFWCPRSADLGSARVSAQFSHRNHVLGLSICVRVCLCRKAHKNAHIRGRRPAYGLRCATQHWAIFRTACCCGAQGLSLGLTYSQRCVMCDGRHVDLCSLRVAMLQSMRGK